MDRRPIPACLSDLVGGRIIITRDHLHRLQRGLCYLCGGSFRRRPYRMRMSEDHVYPRSADFSFHGNRLLSHIGCNGQKAARWPRPCEQLYLASINLMVKG